MTDTVDISPVRSVGGITFQATVREVATDTLEATQQPIERGAPITDHAFNRPGDLVIEAWSSNSSDEAGDDPDYVNNLYQQLLALKQSAQLFQVVTGKRVYDQMLMLSLAQTTDVKSEFALGVTMSLREIFVVDTVTTTAPPVADQGDPTKTAGPTNQGTTNLTPSPQVNQSALSQIFGR